MRISHLNLIKVSSKHPKKMGMVIVSIASTAHDDEPALSSVFLLAALASATSQRNDNRHRNKTTETNPTCQRRMVISSVILLVIALKSLLRSMSRRWVGLAKFPYVKVTCRKKTTHRHHLMTQWELRNARVRRCPHYGENDVDDDGNVHGDVNETWDNVHTVHGSMENG